MHTSSAIASGLAQTTLDDAVLQAHKFVYKAQISSKYRK